MGTQRKLGGWDGHSGLHAQLPCKPQAFQGKWSVRYWGMSCVCCRVQQQGMNCPVCNVNIFNYWQVWRTEVQNGRQVQVWGTEVQKWQEWSGNRRWQDVLRGSEDGARPALLAAKRLSKATSARLLECTCLPVARYEALAGL